MQTVSRLITYFVPEHYQLSLDLHREGRTFRGIVTINGISPATTDRIVLHAKDLTIESVTYDGKEASFSAGKDDELTITHPDLGEGRHIIVVAFSGAITDGMHGLYPCYYEHEGKKKELLATQFESHHAREVFPCIDEPAAKATFDVTLTTEKDITVLGNMPIISQKVEHDRLVSTFATTPRMSTYLLAWVYGELHRKTTVTKRGVEVNVWATPAQASESLDFALDIATRTIDFFDEYFGVAYPLPKSDHVALPDFSSGAMENWGLVTYREIALLADPKTASVSSKHYIATVIAHELSHQWFGNLVTMKWWNDLWLNESFATLMEYIAVDALHPEWSIWLDFSTYESIIALRRDSIDGVQAVKVAVHHPDEINTLFDPSIVYAKGSRLLRMCQQYLGHEAFQSGLKAYFEKYKYGNTEGDDLWNELSKASGKDITHLMNTWISQSGFPVLHVAQSNDEVTLEQEQFFVGPHTPSNKLWPIPLNSPDGAMPELLEEKTVRVTRSDSLPLRFNISDSAHFITHYDNALLVQLLDAVKAKTMAPLDRLQLLHEQMLLARGSVIRSAELVPLLDAYSQEASEPVWDIISMTIGELKKFVINDEASENQLRKLARSIATEEYERLGWEQKPHEPETDTKLRATIVSTMLYGEDREAIDAALSLYSDHPLEELNPELRPLIIGVAVRHNHSSELINSLIDRYKATASADLQQDIASGLTNTKDKATIKRLLELIKDQATVRPQDAGHWFVWLIRNRDGRALAWQWLQDNWDWIDKTFKGDKSYDDFPRYSATALLTRQELEEYRAFFAALQSDPALARVITVGISEIEGRVELIERDGADVRDALAKL